MSTLHKTGLAAFAVLAFASLVGVSVWATGHQSIAVAIGELNANPGGGNNPWFVATLFDAYFGFLWFWLWVAYKETGWVSRGVWLALILLTGNMAMAAYVLIELWRLPRDGSIEQLLSRRRSA